MVYTVVVSTSDFQLNFHLEDQKLGFKDTELCFMSCFP